MQLFIRRKHSFSSLYKIPKHWWFFAKHSDVDLEKEILTSSFMHALDASLAAALGYHSLTSFMMEVCGKGISSPSSHQELTFWSSGTWGDCTTGLTQVLVCAVMTSLCLQLQLMVSLLLQLWARLTSLQATSQPFAVLRCCLTDLFCPSFQMEQ